MDSYRLVLAFLVLMASVSLATAYQSQGSTDSPGTTADDSPSGSTSPECYYNLDSCDSNGGGDDTPAECEDGKDNNGLWGRDYDPGLYDDDGKITDDENGDGYPGDPGCSTRFDHTESMMWDTDLTATMEELPDSSLSFSGDETVYFKDQRVIAGNEVSSKEFPDKMSGGDYVERHVGAAYSETGDGLYTQTGLGSDPSSQSKKTYTDLPSGSVESDGRLVDPPNPLGSATCGDGYYQDSEYSGDGELPGEEKDARQYDDSKKESSPIECRVDYGKVLLQPSFDGGTFNIDEDDEGDLGELDNDGNLKDSFTTIYGKEDLNVKDDEEEPECVKEDEKTGECEDWDCDQVGADAPESVTTNDYWTISGDTMTRHKVERVGPWRSNDEISCGDDYEWDNNYRTVNCNDWNNHDGGGDRGLNTASRGNVDQDYSKAENDPAGTFTDYTAYSADLDPGHVWCAFDPSNTITVDADGPKGRGDGFVVIKSGEEIIGTKGPTNADTVGKMVHSKLHGDSLSKSSRNYLQRTLYEGQWSLDCPSNANYCIKYLDFYTKDSGWSTEDQAVAVDAITVDGKKAITPDQSYSACKFINQIHSRSAGEDRELLDCDYEASAGGAGGDMSPLLQACGDTDKEHLITAEGNQLDFGFLSKEIFYSQKCVDYSSGGDVDASGVTKPGSDEVRTVSEKACVLNHLAYAEGSVVDVAQYDRGTERGDYSPDYEVCLDADLDINDRQEWDNVENQGPKDQSLDLGGEWYDLDDQRVQEYVRKNFDASDYDNQARRVETFMRSNVNPQHPDFNPTGDSESPGLAMEDDCGNDRFADGFQCEEEKSRTSTGNLFFTFFNTVIESGS
ncbi:MAG: hypothetical protein ABEK01_05600 [Candidatus Nanohaloarchaea archaeon]